MAGEPIEVLAGAAAATSPARNVRACPDEATERLLAEVLADVTGAEQVLADSNFFDDLGADSLLMARFCARVRKRPDLPTVSMKDVYGHPTIRSLAAALAAAEPGPDQPIAHAPIEAASPTSTLQYLLCGALQFAFFLGYCYLAALAIASGYGWISAGSSAADTYLRLVLCGAALFFAACTIPILAKWMLVGRWKQQRIRIWSLAYLRFWVVKTLIRANPLAFGFVGTPLYPLYLRALGANVGRGVAIFTRSMPVCTDLLTIGSGTVIRKDSFLTCYRAHAGWIQTGAVALGRDAFVGERTVLDIGTSMGDGSQLGHSSALHSGQAVPAGESWHGSPAQRTDLNYLRVGPTRCGRLRRATYCVLSLLLLLLVYLPLAEAAVYLVVTRTPALARMLHSASPLASSALYVDSLLLSLALFFGAVLLGLAFVLTAPRVLNLFLRVGAVYPLYGVHDRLHRAIARMTNVKFFTYLFGDSSYIVYYLRWLGYDLSEVEQTGSNFGTEVSHETPYLSSIGTGTMVADGLSIMNADFSSTSFRVSRVSIGPHNFVGNNIAYPPGGRTGENCLLATKAMIPLDGKIRADVGLLGSPCFEIPRSVERDHRFDHLRTGEELHCALIAKNRYNVRTIGVFLLARWLHVFLLVTLGLAALDAYQGFAKLSMAGFLALAFLITPAYFVLVERGLRAFRPLQPAYCSIYHPYFWRQERLWKVPAITYLHMFDGTPFKNVIWRGLGVRIGKRVFDDGCYLTERSLATIGDDCALNQGSKIQCHSQEDGTFKSDRSSIGAGCTLGVGAMIHYGVLMGEGSVLAADSFLMKGEEVAPHASWGGNPAREM